MTGVYYLARCGPTNPAGPKGKTKSFKSLELSSFGKILLYFNLMQKLQSESYKMSFLSQLCCKYALNPAMLWSNLKIDQNKSFSCNLPHNLLCLYSSGPREDSNKEWKNKSNVRCLCKIVNHTEIL